MKRFIFLCLLIILGLSCADSHHDSTRNFIPKQPDYADTTLWYVERLEAGTDVFYITPTCIFDWKDSATALPCYHYDVYGEVMKENFNYSLQLAQDIFGKECNFYAPYYRQISLESWLLDEEVIEERFEPAMEDVERAFQYYLKHENQGRPFVLAGYSQGAKAVVELLKRMSDKAFSQVKAAYVIGYRITAEDLKHKHIRPAQGETDQGVVICYNSVKTPQDIWKAVADRNCACINPVNWRTDAAPAQLNDSISVEIDTQHQVLLVKGYDGGGIEIPLLKGHVSEGNYHLSELTLFQQQLQENVLKRIRPQSSLQE